MLLKSIVGIHSKKGMRGTRISEAAAVLAYTIRINGQAKGIEGALTGFSIALEKFEQLDKRENLIKLA